MEKQLAWETLPNSDIKMALKQYGQVTLPVFQVNPTITVVMAENLGKVVGYAPKYLTDYLRKICNRNPQDPQKRGILQGYYELSTEASKEIQAFLSKYVSATGTRFDIGTSQRNLAAITEDAMFAVLGQSTKPMARSLQGQLAINYGAQQVAEKKVDLAVPEKTAPAKTPEGVAKDRTEAAVQSLRSFSLALTEMQKFDLLSKYEAQALARRCAHAIVTGIEKQNDAMLVVHDASHGILSLPTPVVGLPDTVTDQGGKFTVGMNLPAKYRGWKTAHNIADNLGISENTVGRHISDLVREYGTELRANKLAAEQKIIDDPQKWKACIDPETGLATVQNDNGTCIALFSQSQDGHGFHWRNYWSPETFDWMIEEISKRMDGNKKEAKK